MKVIFYILFSIAACPVFAQGKINCVENTSFKQKFMQSIREAEDYISGKGERKKYDEGLAFLSRYVFVDYSKTLNYSNTYANIEPDKKEWLQWYEDHKCENLQETVILYDQKAADSILNEVFISFQNLDTKTPLPISCEDFNQQLSSSSSSSLKYISLRDKLKIATVDKLFNQIRNTKPLSYVALDVRYILVLTYRSLRQETICGNRLYIEIDDNIYKASPELIKIMETEK